jgi:2'-5' RNA ligase
LRQRCEPPADFEMIVNDLGLPSSRLPIDRIQLIRSLLAPGGPSYAVIDEWWLGQEARAPRALNHG